MTPPIEQVPRGAGGKYIQRRFKSITHVCTHFFSSMRTESIEYSYTLSWNQSNIRQRGSRGVCVCVCMCSDEAWLASFLRSSLALMMTNPHEGLTHLDSSTPFEASNIALLGSKARPTPLRAGAILADAHPMEQIDHHLKDLSAHEEPAWKSPGVGKEGGVWAWVIEDFKVVPFKKGDLETGDFHEGDSYIVLKVRRGLVIKWGRT